MLEVSNLAVSYGRHRALEGVSVKVDKGEVCVILGANGAGKSTLLKAISGMVHAERGSEITMNGKAITDLKPHLIVERGVALVPEGRGIFADLTVAENLQLGAFAARARRNEAATLDFIYTLFPRLAERRRQVVRTMSGGEQQMVAIGRALMSKPEILMLDEPSLGLSPLLTQELFRSLKEIAATGVGILLVEQNAKQSLKIAGRGYLIENGAVTGENNAAALMRDPAVINAYLGGAGGRTARPAIALPAPMRLPADIAAMGGRIGELAARAGNIQKAFARALRQGSELPSAFVGRYDPKSAGDPWTSLEQEPEPQPLPTHAPAVSRDARRLGNQANLLASRAAERLAGHVKSARLSAPRPSAFAQIAQAYEASPPVEPARAEYGPDRSPPAAPAGYEVISAEPPAAEASTEKDAFADLARRAAERAADFVRQRRATAQKPAAFTPMPAASMPEFAQPEVRPPRPRIAQPAPAAKRPNGSASLIGHNSNGVDLDADARLAGGGPGPFAELAAHAASIHAAFVAEKRKRLTAFTIPSQTGAPAKSNPNDSAPDKRNKHKEA